MPADEKYIIDLCDQVLGSSASRQHRFDFLRGDTGRRLPVDAYYAERKLVIEYHERQHTSSVAFWDKKLTSSGISRGEQRARYDQRRLEELPKHGIKPVFLDYSMFQVTSAKRLKRDPIADEAVIREQIRAQTLDIGNRDRVSHRH